MSPAMSGPRSWRRRVGLSGLVLTLGLAAAFPGLALARTVTVGPAMGTLVNAGFGCAFEHPSCAYANVSLQKPQLTRIPARGTITTWRVETFDGTARLLILLKRHGQFQVVTRSRRQFKKCVVTNSSGICGPGFSRVYTFHTHLSVKSGEYLGIQLLSPKNCNTTPDDQTCSNIGYYDGTTVSPVHGSSYRYFDPAQSSRLSSPKKEPGGNGQIMVNADLRTG